MQNDPKNNMLSNLQEVAEKYLFSPISDMNITAAATGEQSKNSAMRAAHFMEKPATNGSPSSVVTTTTQCQVGQQKYPDK